MYYYSVSCESTLYNGADLLSVEAMVKFRRWLRDVTVGFFFPSWVPPFPGEVFDSGVDCNTQSYTVLLQEQYVQYI